MKKIPLTQGQFALVDDADFKWLSQWKWFAHKCRNNWYARGYLYSRNGKKTSIHLHRLLMRPPLKMVVDHINGNGLDNRKLNLRICSQAQNIWNTGKRKTNTSGFKGVSYDKQRLKWRSRISRNKKEVWLGYFNSKKEAALVYNRFVKNNRDKFAFLNLC